MVSIKAWVQAVLGITTLQVENQLLAAQNKKLRKQVKRLNDVRVEAIDNRLGDLEHMWASLSTQAREALIKANKLNATGQALLKNFDLAVDVGVREPSWAVLVSNGQPQRVYFIDLRGADMQHIQALLQRYAGTRQTVDAPYGLVKPYKRIEDII